MSKTQIYICILLTVMVAAYMLYMWRSDRRMERADRDLVEYRRNTLRAVQEAHVRHDEPAT